MVTFIEKLFTERSFDADFLLVDAVGGEGEVKVKMPDGIRRDQFLAWIEALSPTQQSPVWLGLPDAAENVILTTQGTKTRMKMMRMQQIDDDDEEEGGGGGGSAEAAAAVRLDSESGGRDGKDGGGGGVPAWMKNLGSMVAGWLAKLPQSLALLKRSRDNIKDPLFRFFDREVKLGAAILRTVRADLRELQEICSGEKRQTNHHREVAVELLRGVIPRSWLQYKVSGDMTAALWVADFARRVQQLERVVGLVSSGTLKSSTFWLGGLFTPEAFITATRQCVAQANSWSLEDLKLDVYIGDGGEGGGSEPVSMDDFSFGIEGLKMHGAASRRNEVYIEERDVIVSELSTVRLRWINKSDEKQNRAAEQAVITLPVYLNANRKDVLFSAEFRLAQGQSRAAIVEKGVAVVANA